MANDENSLRELARETVDRLTTWRDEAKVRAHLASMDARTAWNEVEPQVDRITNRLRDVLDATVPGGSEQARLELQLGVAEAQDRLTAMERRFEVIGHDLAREGREALATLRSRLGTMIDKHH